MLDSNQSYQQRQQDSGMGLGTAMALGLGGLAIAGGALSLIRKGKRGKSATHQAAQTVQNSSKKNYSKKEIARQRKLNQQQINGRSKVDENRESRQSAIHQRNINKSHQEAHAENIGRRISELNAGGGQVNSLASPLQGRADAQDIINNLMGNRIAGGARQPIVGGSRNPAFVNDSIKAGMPEQLSEQQVRQQLQAQPNTMLNVDAAHQEALNIQALNARQARLDAFNKDFDQRATKAQSLLDNYIDSGVTNADIITNAELAASTRQRVLQNRPQRKNNYVNRMNQQVGVNDLTFDEARSLHQQRRNNQRINTQTQPAPMSAAQRQSLIDQYVNPSAKPAPAVKPTKKDRKQK